MVVEHKNREPGTLSGYDCPKCLNRGSSEAVQDGRIVSISCSCIKVRNALARIERSGLAGNIDRCTFENFKTKHLWQSAMKDTALRYVQAVKGGKNPWFYVGGQPGCGKTHLCTAICGELLRAGIPVKYTVWAEEAERIKACRMDVEALDEFLEPLKSIDVLYIDDLLKTMNNGKCKPKPTDADIKLCFEVLNHRYVRKMPTIISCEWSLLGDLMGVDEGTFSRVHEMTKGYTAEISRSGDKNYRLSEV